MVQVFAFYIVGYWILYLFILYTVIILSKLIYKSTSSKFLVGSFCLAVFVLAMFHVLYGECIYIINKNSWPKHIVNKSIDTFVISNDFDWLVTTDKKYDTKVILSSLSKIYNSKDRNVSSEIQKEFQLIFRPQNIKKYIVLKTDINSGICEMNAVEIYDISTGDVLGISRKIHLYGIDPYFPFFVSFFGPDGAATYPHDSPYKERHTAALMKEIFPNYSGFTNY